MLASSSSSFSFGFLPRQIMLNHNAAAAAMEDGKERRKEKKDKKKRASSDNLELDRPGAGSQPCKGQGRDVLLRSIAAFLDNNGFSRTLSVLLSEAELESGCWQSSTVNLESIFCKFLDSSDDITEGNISLLSNQDLQKVIISNDHVMDPSSEKKTDKKKRKRKDQVDGMETGTNKEGLSSEIVNLSANDLAESHEKYKGEKKKNKVLTKVDDDIAEPNESKKLEMVKAKEEELVSIANDSIESSKKLKSEKKKDKKIKQVELEAENTSKKKSSEIADLSASELAESHEKHKGERKKKKLTEIYDEMAEPNDSKKLEEMVKDKGEEPVSLTLDSIESSKKMKSEKKRDKKLKQGELEPENSTKNKSNDTNLVAAEGHTFPASEVTLVGGSQDKIKKKKKSKSDVAPNLSSDQVGGQKTSDQVVTESEDLTTKGVKKTSKKRKVPDLEEKSDDETARKVTKVKSEGAENNEGTADLIMLDKSMVDSVTQIITKEKKMNGSKESAKVAEKQLDLSTKSKENVNASDSDNEVLATQLGNASSEKKEKHSAEPKSATPFQRVKTDGVKYADNRLKDNSYWAKDGADIGYGAKAQEVLGQVRGRNFRHEKTKKKRGSYRGGQIDLESHSIKFDDSDDE